MAFTYDPTTDRGKVRLNVMDTTSSTSYFTDADIDAFLEQNSDSIWLASADACRSLAAKFITSGFLLEMPGALKIDKKRIPEFYMNLSREYQRRAEGSSDTIREFFDSYDLNYDDLGIDNSEYVGD